MKQCQDDDYSNQLVFGFICSAGECCTLWGNTWHIDLTMTHKLSQTKPDGTKLDFSL